MKTASKFLVKIPKEDGLFEDLIISSVSEVCKLLKISNYTFYSIVNNECKYQQLTKHLKDYQIIPLQNNTNEEIITLKQTLKQKTTEFKKQKSTTQQLHKEFIAQNMVLYQQFLESKKDEGLVKGSEGLEPKS
jgi:hypothetical protein